MFWKKHKNEVKPDTTVHSDYRAIALTDQGNIRTNNEDQVLFFRPSDPGKRKTKGYLAIVADGMGGHAAGEIASTLAVKWICQTYFASTLPPLEALEEATNQANAIIYEESRRSEKKQGMGTTCTAVVLLGQELYIAHIGDSRAYLLTDDHLYQLTTDHTYVQELLQAGKIDPVEAVHHPQRNVLSRAMGTQPNRKGDVFHSDFSMKNGNVLLLCTDGLYDYFSSDEMQQIILDNKLHEAAELLIQEAKNRGGHDNLSVLLVAPHIESNQSSNPTEFLNEPS